MIEGQENTAEREESFILFLLLPSLLLMITFGDKTQVRFLAYQIAPTQLKNIPNLLQVLQA